MSAPARIALVGTGAFSVVVLATVAVRPLGALVAVASLLALAWWRPALLLALALNGFFVYLAVVDLAGQDRATTAYYAALGVALLVAAWRGRHRVRARIATADWGVRVWMLATCGLAIWFVANGVILRSGGREAKVLVGEFVAVTVPSVILVFALERRALREFFVGLVLLGCALVVADALALAHGASLVDYRFSPLAGLDPISAGLVPAFSAAALLSFDFGDWRRRLLQVVVLAVLIAAAGLPGSRGPVAVVAAAVVVAVACGWRRRLVPVAAAAVVGGLLAWGAGAWAGSTPYLTQGLGDPLSATKTAPSSSTTTPPFSTIRIRKYWIKSAITAVPDKPWFGHGLVSLPDMSAEADAMGVKGQRVYPHNDAVEAIYSLGILGLALFLLALVTPGFLMRRAGPAYAATILFAGAFVEANFSGEIGADGLLWSAAALLVVARVDRRRAEVGAVDLQRE